jgi:hypothetical protein
MDTDDDTDAVRRLLDTANRVAYASSGSRWRRALQQVFGGPVPVLPWRDAPSQNRPGWRERAADLHGDEVFGIDYQVYRRCRLGWVEEPSTDEPYQRRGLATAALVALRQAHPSLSWHTLGGHLSDSRRFWEAAGVGVPGGYRPREVCEHVRP